MIVNEDIEAYATVHTTSQPGYLAALTDETHAILDAPHMLTGPLEGRFLQTLVFALSARRILEIGTFSGYSALSMAAGMPADGRIITCEISQRHAEVARRHIAASPFAGSIEIRMGPALETIASLEGEFDFVFIDADKGNYPAYYEAAIDKLAPTGLIAVDNTLWSGKVLDAKDGEPDTVAIRKFNDTVAADPRVIAVQLTVRDGVTLIRRADGVTASGANDASRTG